MAGMQGYFSHHREVPQYNRSLQVHRIKPSGILDPEGENVLSRWADLEIERVSVLDSDGSLPTPLRIQEPDRQHEQPGYRMQMALFLPPNYDNDEGEKEECAFRVFFCPHPSGPFGSRRHRLIPEARCDVFVTRVLRDAQENPYSWANVGIERDWQDSVWDRSFMQGLMRMPDSEEGLVMPLNPLSDSALLANVRVLSRNFGLNFF